MRGMSIEGKIADELDELKRFREREPLVQALIKTCDENRWKMRDDACDDIESATFAVRDFKLT